MQASVARTSLKLSAISFAIATLVAACGGGGGAQGSTGPSVSVTGAAVKGPIANATVCFYELLTTGKGAQLACTNTTADGNYSINLSYSGGVFVEATGGTYTDETTGLNTSLTSPLTSVGVISGTGSVVVATPLTTLATTQAVKAGNLTTVSFGTAASSIASSFGVTGSITTTIPNVALGTNNSYGSALISISKMISAGANLSSILQASNVTELQQSAANASMCIVAADPTVPNSTASYAGTFKIPNSPNYVPGGTPFTPVTTISALEPNSRWRALVSAQGTTAMNCTVHKNTPYEVVLTCPQSAMHSGNVDFYSGRQLANFTSPTQLPSTGVLVAAKRIDYQGTLGSLLPSSFGFNLGCTPSGSASTTGNSMTINQNNQTMAINWQSFSIGSGNTVIFNQPNSNSIAVNRVIGNNRSEVFGNLVANGQPFLINPTGVTQSTNNPITITPVTTNNN